MTDSIKEVRLEATFTYKSSDQIQSDNGNGTLVFKGLFNGTIPIALKRYQNTATEAEKHFEELKKVLEGFKKDLDVLSSSDNRHPHFIRYYGSTKDETFSYIVTELCECSVADLIDPKRKDGARKKTPHFDSIVASLSHKMILRQSSEAVSFLHGLGKIHRNLHPNNFLIFCVDPMKDDFIIKLTDFQLSKNIKKEPQNTGTLNKDGWVAPESFVVKAKLSNKVDSFIMGCFYFYVLSGGKHPFGKGVDNQRNRIRVENDPVYQSSWDGTPDWNNPLHNYGEQEEMKWALQMIKSLLKFKPQERVSMDDVLKNKYFQLEPYVIYDNPSSPLPGLCIILSQEKFKNPEDNLDSKLNSAGDLREGIGLDVKRLKETFTSFGYDIFIYKNLRASQIKSYLSAKELEKELAKYTKKSRQKKSLKDYASLIVCLLGHGNKGVLADFDGVPVSLNEIQYEAFNDEACPELKGKPKVFIVLACQGEREQNLVPKVPKKNDESCTIMDSAVNIAINTNNDDDRLPLVYDFIRLVSTIEEYKSYFRYGVGSVYIKSLCDALSNEYKDVTINERKERNKRDLTQLFTEFVIPIVGRSGYGSGGYLKQTPELRTSLVKTIRFRCQEKHGVLLNEYDGAS